jgi:hypothetical protein
MCGKSETCRQATPLFKGSATRSGQRPDRFEKWLPASQRLAAHRRSKTRRTVRAGTGYLLFAAPRRYLFRRPFSLSQRNDKLKLVGHQTASFRGTSYEPNLTPLSNAQVWSAPLGWSAPRHVFNHAESRGAGTERPACGDFNVGHAAGPDGPGD